MMCTLCDCGADRMESKLEALCERIENPLLVELLTTIGVRIQVMGDFTQVLDDDKIKAWDRVVEKFTELVLDDES